MIQHIAEEAKAALGEAKQTAGSMWLDLHPIDRSGGDIRSRTA